MSFLSWDFFKAPAPETLSCSNLELAIFTRQLSLLIRSGIPLAASLESLSWGDDPLSGRVVPAVTSRVTQGARLSTAMKAFPRVFPPAYIWVIHSAEETGTLHILLDSLADWLERQDRLMRQVRKALTYPMLVLIVTLVLTIGLFRSVIPSILDAVVGLGADLPAPTKALLALVYLLQSPWTWLMVIVVAAVGTGYLRSPSGQRRLLDLLLKLPVTGSLLRSAATARTALTLSMLLEFGIEVMRACLVAGSSGGLPQFAEDAERVRAELREGCYLSQAYTGSSLYPPIFCEMLKAGEESGKLSDLLRRAGNLLEEETFSRLETLANVLEPLILAGLSLAVGFILIAVMMPMSSMLGAL